MYLVRKDNAIPTFELPRSSDWGKIIIILGL